MRTVALAAMCALIMGTAAADIGVQPLVEFLLSNNLENSGSLGGEAQLFEYAPDEGPVFAPGVRGFGVSFARSSRGGGSEKTQAGGAIVFDGAALEGLPQMTLVTWFRPVGNNAPARLMYYPPSWDFMVSGQQLGFKVTHEKRDYGFNTGRDDPAAVSGRWNFAAITFDRETGTGRCYHALSGDAPRLVAEWTEIPAPDIATADLQIGNLQGIRPFRGDMDSVRLYDCILSAEQIAELCQTEVRTVTLKDAVNNQPVLAPIFEHGDVCLSSRSAHANSIETIESFRANRIMWCYPSDADFIKRCKEASGGTYQGAINSIAGVDCPEGQSLDFDGNPVVAPWMVTFSKDKPWYWGCNNRPAFMEQSVTRAKALLDAGADMLQFDDWSMIVSSGSWGGACFCDECMKGFREYLAKRLSAEQLSELGIEDIASFNYHNFLTEKHEITDAETYKGKRRALPTNSHFESFQRHSVRTFFTELRERINAEAGRTVPMSVNSVFYRPAQSTNFIPDIVDFLEGETWEMSLSELAVGAKTAESLGKWQVFVPKPRDVRVARMAVAAVYAMGQFMLVPWDMYMGSDATGVRPRYYGTVEEYGDLYHFVRDYPELFNGYENPGIVGVVVSLDTYDHDALKGMLTKLFDAQVPFALLPVGHEYYDASLDAERLSQFDALVTMDPMDRYSEEDRAAITKAGEQVPVFSASQATEESLKGLSPIEVWAPRDVHVIPRITRDPEDKSVVCHVLNRAEMEGQDALRWLSFMIRRGVCPGEKLVSAKWYAPGQEPVEMEVDVLANGYRVIIPRAPIWGIAKLQFE